MMFDGCLDFDCIVIVDSFKNLFILDEYQEGNGCYVVGFVDIIQVFGIDGYLFC